MIVCHEKYINIPHSHLITEGVARHLRYSSETSTFYQKDLVQSVSGVTAVYPLIAFYILGREGEVLFFYSVPLTTGLFI
jgi:hypothetical protein